MSRTWLILIDNLRLVAFAGNDILDFVDFDYYKEDELLSFYDTVIIVDVFIVLFFVVLFMKYTLYKLNQF